jgi:hypothetical protein
METLGSFDGGDCEHSGLQVGFVGGLAAEWPDEPVRPGQGFYSDDPVARAPLLEAHPADRGLWLAPLVFVSV